MPPPDLPFDVIASLVSFVPTGPDADNLTSAFAANPHLITQRDKNDRYHGQEQLRVAVRAGRLALFKRVTHPNQPINTDLLTTLVTDGRLAILRDCIDRIGLPQLQIQHIFLQAVSTNDQQIMDLALMHMEGGLQSLSPMDLWTAVIDNDTPLCVTTARALLSVPGGPSYSLNRLLRFAVKHRNHHITRLLIEAGANVQGLPAAKFADLFESWSTMATEECGKTALLLVMAGHECTRDQATMLLYYATRDQLATLAQHGANFKSRLSNGNLIKTRGEFPMHNAARSGDASLVQALIDAGALPNRLGNGSLSPIHCVTSRAVVEVLTEHGVNVNFPDMEGKSPLFLAMHNRHYGAVQALLAAGADHAFIYNGMSLMKMAYRSDNLALVYHLLTNDADPTIEEWNYDEEAAVLERRHILVLAAEEHNFSLLEGLRFSYPRIYQMLSADIRAQVFQALEAWPDLCARLTETCNQQPPNAPN